MAELNRILQAKARNSVYTLVKEDGTNTEPGVDTIRQIARSHFPTATEGTPKQIYDTEI